MAELQNIKSYGRYYEMRKPRVVKRLIELGQTVHPSDMPASDRHSRLEQDIRRLREDFEADGLTGEWRGKA